MFIPQVFKTVADSIDNDGFEAIAEVAPNDQPCITIAGRGRFFIMAEGDRGYFWQGEDSTEKGNYFTCDLYLSDGEEIADSLFDLLMDKVFENAIVNECDCEGDGEYTRAEN